MGGGLETKSALERYQLNGALEDLGHNVLNVVSLKKVKKKKNIVIV